MESATPIEETGVVDRFEDEYAVVVLRLSQRRLDVNRSTLPPDVGVGTWVRVLQHPDGTVRLVADPDATEAARDRVAEKLARLRRGDHLRSRDQQPSDDES